MTEITNAPTDAELNRWERLWRAKWRIYKKNDSPVLRLITAYRESQAEVRRLREKVALCPHCGIKLAEQHPEKQRLLTMNEILRRQLERRRLAPVLMSRGSKSRRSKFLTTEPGLPGG